MTGAAMAKALAAERQRQPKERPIPFSTEMVSALLAGRKSQTRRIMKSQPPFQPEPYTDELGSDWFCNGSTWARKCPYGVAGDRLWVRESWRAPATLDDVRPSLIPPGTVLDFSTTDESTAVNRGRLRSARFMPRAFSRIWLEITDVRVQRLQDISEEDALAEGLFEWTGDSGAKHYGVGLSDVWEQDPRRAFERLWRDINGPESWEANPWVWVISFWRLP